jgi:hypothetical protein
MMPGLKASDSWILLIFPFPSALLKFCDNIVIIVYKRKGVSFSKVAFALP